MKTQRFTLTSLFALVFVLLAACSQAPAPQTPEEPTLNAQGLVWQTRSLAPTPSSDPKVTPDLGLYTSIALSSTGNPIIAYYDNTRSEYAPYSAGDIYGNGDLKLMVCGNPTCTSGNTLTTVDAGRIQATEDVGKYLSMVLDRFGFPVISYVHAREGLKLARCFNLTCTMKSIQGIGQAYTDVRHTSLALDHSNKPVISYAAFNPNSNSFYLSLAHCADSNCDSRFGLPTIKPVGRGLDSALALDINGNAIISHYDYLTQDLEVARCDAVDTSTNPCPSVVVDSAGDVGKYTALKLMPIVDPFTGKITKEIPFISYYDATGGDLKIAYCGDASCTGNNYLQTLDSTGNVGQYTSVALNIDSPVISYYDVTNGDLKVAKCDSGSLLTQNPIRPCQDTSRNTFQTVDNDGLANLGQYSSVAVDGSGNAAISYYDATNRSLKWARQTYTSDTTPPTAAPSITDTSGNPISANASGWYNKQIIVKWNWSDDESGSGIDTPNCTTSTTSSGQGKVTLSATCNDVDGNRGSASLTVKIDITKPVVNVLMNGSVVSGITPSYSLAQGIPTASCTTTDARSGVATSASLNLVKVTTSGEVAAANPPAAVGTYRAKCLGALDNADNANAKTITFKVTK